MRHVTITEPVAVLVSFMAVVVGATLPFVHEARSLHSRIAPGTQVVTLTGIAEAGYWTDEEVRGGNHRNGSLHPARPILQVGEPVLFRLKSADVVHSFYSPGLGIGPIGVYPGNVVEVVVTPKEDGVFDYYCTTMCGDRHFAMRGVVIVGGEGSRLSESTSASVDKYWLKPSPSSATRVELGEWLFHQKGCATCHGSGGQGGVRNWNYVRETVPALNTLAENMLLFSPEDVKAIVEYLEQGVSLESLEDSPPVHRFGAVLAQYRYFRNVILKGNPAGKKDPNGPPPPLEMPAWQYRLSDEDVDAVIAYLLTENPREETER